MIKDLEIDLTENRDFSIEERHPIFIRGRDGILRTNINEFAKRIIQKQLYGKFPWNVIPVIDKCYQYDGLFALGNSEQREAVIIESHWGTLNNVVCDCCGKEYIKIPWRKNWGLCEECDKENYKSIIFPWN